MTNPRGRHRWFSFLVLVLLVPVAAILVLRFILVPHILGRPPVFGTPVDGVIVAYGQPYYDSRVEKSDGPNLYTLFFSADTILGPRALYVRVEDGKVAESWTWSK